MLNRGRAGRFRRYQEIYRGNIGLYRRYKSRMADGWAKIYMQGCIRRFPPSYPRGSQLFNGNSLLFNAIMRSLISLEREFSSNTSRATRVVQQQQQ